MMDLVTYTLYPFWLTETLLSSPEQMQGPSHGAEEALAAIQAGDCLGGAGSSAEQDLRWRTC